MRIRAVTAVEMGDSYQSAADRILVSVSSLYRCRRLYFETGTVDISPLPGDDRSRQLQKMKGWRMKEPGLTIDRICERLAKHLILRSSVWHLLDGRKPHPTKRKNSGKAKSARRKRFYLTPQQPKRIRRFFPKSRGKPRVSDWRVVSGIIYVLINGMPWHEAPPEYGPCKTLCNRWKRWCDKGTFLQILLALALESGKTDVLMLDLIHIKARRVACSLGLHSGTHGREIGRTKGGLNCKLHLVTDAAGRPILLFQTAGNASDIGGAKAWPDAHPSGVKVLVADRAYDAN